MGGTVGGKSHLLPPAHLWVTLPSGYAQGMGQPLPSGRRLHVCVLAQGEMRVGRKHCVARRHDCGSVH